MTGPRGVSHGHTACSARDGASWERGWSATRQRTAHMRSEGMDGTHTTELGDEHASGLDSHARGQSERLIGEHLGCREPAAARAEVAHARGLAAFAEHHAAARRADAVLLRLVGQRVVGCQRAHLGRRLPRRGRRARRHRHHRRGLHPLRAEGRAAGLQGRRRLCGREERRPRGGRGGLRRGLGRGLCARPRGRFARRTRR